MVQRPTALITGITGQDGSYLAEFLLNKGYVVHGTVRRSSSFSTGRIEHIFHDLNLHFADLCDPASLYQVLLKSKPDEIYNLGAQSHVRVSFDQPDYTFETVALGVVNLLDAIQRLDRPVKFYQASSSEMFGSSPPPQCEMTPFRPQSPYAVAKVAAFHSVANAREGHGLFACNGVLFNHESPRRGETFVTRKITRAAARIKLGLQNRLMLGNLESRRDWGFAGDYIEAMWLMLQQEKPDDYVIATGESHSIREFLDETFALAGIDWHDRVDFDERLLRPLEVNHLRGDASKAERVLGWKPKTDFKSLVKMMYESDLELARHEKLIRDSR